MKKFRVSDKLGHIGVKSKLSVSCSVAMIKIAGTKSNDKINFKEFVDFFYKVD